MESGAGDTRKRRRKAETRAFPRLAIMSALCSGERSGAQEAGGESEVCTVPLALSNQVGMSVVRERYKPSCQVLPPLLLLSPWFT